MLPTVFSPHVSKKFGKIAIESVLSVVWASPEYSSAFAIRRRQPWLLAPSSSPPECGGVRGGV
jgi:hypothetical protein